MGCRGEQTAAVIGNTSVGGTVGSAGMETVAEIDFDAASATWRSNKRAIGGGWFAYICGHIHSTGKRCHYVCLKNLDVCKKHRRRLRYIEELHM